MPRSDQSEMTSGVAATWHKRASELARWSWEHYVVRTDVWGGYNPLNVREQQRTRRDGVVYTLGKTCTRPSKVKRGVVTLTTGVLERHFRATAPEHVIGLHTTPPENVSKWGTIEVDYHGPGGNDAEANWRAAKGWHDALSGRGFHPLLWDSNGAGGYHLDVLLSQAVQTPLLFWFLRELVGNHTQFGLPAMPETFPKQPQVNPEPNGKGHYGNWVRLIGLHHTKVHWAKVWDGANWREGEAAVDFVLGLRGDSSELVPADSEVRGRINAYLRNIPNRGEGQGRDDVAYTFLAFMARDLALSDEEALRWAAEWDNGNTPPKGIDRLREILQNVHNYGRNAYGSRLHAPARGGAPPETQPGAKPLPEQDRDGLGIILADYRERLRPRFRREQAVFSEALGRVVKPAEGCFAPDRLLVTKLATAKDAPKNGDGVVDPKRLPKFYRDWSRSAWQQMLNDLPEEAEGEEIVASAEEEFRRAVAAGMHEQVTLGREGEDPQRRSLIDWAVLFAKPGPWKQVRSYLLWSKREKEGDPASVAVRVELFGQVRRAGLADMRHRKFAALCERYGIGTANDDDRPCGNRVVVLTAAFVAELRAAPV